MLDETPNPDRMGFIHLRYASSEDSAVESVEVGQGFLTSEDQLVYNTYYIHRKNNRGRERFRVLWEVPISYSPLIENALPVSRNGDSRYLEVRLESTERRAFAKNLLTAYTSTTT